MPWSEQDKQKLLKALHKYGADDIVSLSEELRFKSVTEIRHIINSYQKMATSMLKKQRTMLKMEDACIDKWLKYIIQVSNQPKSAQYISKALKYIALYEKRIPNMDVNLM